MQPYRAACVRVLLCALLLCPTLASAADPLTPGETAAGMRAGEQRSFVEVRGDRLSVRLEGVPWGGVLTELERQTGLPFHLQGFLAGTVTEAFEALPLEQGLRRLLRHVNFILLYAGAKDTPRAGSHVAQVWILPKRDGGRSDIAQAPHPPVRGAEDPLESLITTALAAEAQREEREQAMAALAAYRDPRARGALLQALQDPEEHVRWSTVAALTTVRDEAAADLLSHALLEDASADLRAGAADALGKIASPRAIDALQRALGDESAGVRQSAVEALGMIGGAQATEALKSALGDADPDVTEVAAAVVQHLTSVGSSD
jgi:hypothetical protein